MNKQPKLHPINDELGQALSDLSGAIDAAQAALSKNAPGDTAQAVLPQDATHDSANHQSQSSRNQSEEQESYVQMYFLDEDGYELLKSRRYAGKCGTPFCILTPEIEGYLRQADRMCATGILPATPGECDEQRIYYRLDTSFRARLMRGEFTDNLKQFGAYALVVLALVAAIRSPGWSIFDLFKHSHQEPTTVVDTEPYRPLIRDDDIIGEHDTTGYKDPAANPGVGDKDPATGPNVGIGNDGSGQKDPTVDPWSHPMGDEYQVTVVYVSMTGESLAKDYSTNVRTGDSFSIASPKIVGYEPDQPVVTGVMGQSDIRVVVHYSALEKIEPHMVNIRYLTLPGVPLAPAYVETVMTGDNFSVNSPVIEGYVANQAVVSGVMGDSDVTVTVYYSSTTPGLPVN